jgi:long-chain acyl-CoA synthetase
MKTTNFHLDFFGAIERHAREMPDGTALRSVVSSGAENYSWRRFADEVGGIGHHLVECGITAGDRVALLMENHPRWGIAFVAIQSAGGIVVPLDTLSPVLSLASVAAHSESKFLIASARFSEASREILRDAPNVSGLLIAGGPEWENAVRAQAGVLPLVPREIDDPLAILYTGGTTGKPKGVLLSHRNLYRSIDDMLQVFPLSPQDRVLSVLPLFHIMPLLANLLAPLYTGARVTYLNQLDSQSLMRTFVDEKITAFLCVPQFYYQIRRRILEEIERQPGLKRRLFQPLLHLSGFFRRRFGLPLGRRLFAPVHAKFGGALRAFGVGGAYFNPEAARFFADLGFGFFQAYGLTECSGLATVTPLTPNGGSYCGRAVAHSEVRIHNPDPTGIGEVLVRGENIMQGYWRDKDATASVIQDGWLHTGDLGTLAPDGTLRITGRAKEVIVLSSGKNVFPEEVEEFFQNHSSLIQEMCLVGLEGPDGASLHCVVVPDKSQHTSGDLERGLRGEIEALSRRLPPYKRPASIQIATEALPRTTTRKLQRFKVLEMAAAAASKAAEIEVAEPEGTVECEVIAIIRRIRRDPGPIGLSMNIELDLGLDSLERVELLANVEGAFRIQIPDVKAAQIFSVGDLVEAVNAASPQPHRVHGEPASEWKDWQSIVAEPLNSQENALAEHYLRPRLIPELFWFALTRAFSFAARIFLRLRVKRPAAFLQGPFVLCPNHLSYLDDPLVVGALPFAVFRRIFFLGSSKYFQNPALAWLARTCRVVPVDADVNLLKALRMAKAGLERGMVACIFPEGTRSFDGNLQPLRQGTAILATALGVPVVPMGISGTFEVLPRDRGFQGLHPVAVSAGDPVVPEENETASSFNIRLSQALEREVRAARQLRP